MTLDELEKAVRKGSVSDVESLLRAYGAGSAGGTSALTYIVSGVVNSSGRDKDAKNKLVSDYIAKRGTFAPPEEKISPDVVAEFRTSIEELTAKVDLLTEVILKLVAPEEQSAPVAKQPQKPSRGATP